MESQEPKIEEIKLVELTDNEIEQILNFIRGSDSYDETRDDEEVVALIKKLEDKLAK